MAVSDRIKNIGFIELTPVMLVNDGFVTVQVDTDFKSWLNLIGYTEKEFNALEKDDDAYNDMMNSSDFASDVLNNPSTYKIFSVYTDSDMKSFLKKNGIDSRPSKNKTFIEIAKKDYGKVADLLYYDN